MPRRCRICQWPKWRVGRYRKEYRMAGYECAWPTELNRGDEGAVGGDVAVGHAGRVEGETGIAGAVEQNEAAGGVSAFGEKMHGFARGEMGGGGIAGSRHR